MTDKVVVPATSVELEMALCPPWMLDVPDSIKFPFMWALVIDGSLDWIRLGMLQQFPTSAVANVEAVAALGRDAKISRGQFELQASYAERVRKARTTWRLAGNPRTLLSQIQAYFGPNPPLIRYVVNGQVEVDGAQFADWTSILPDGTFEYHRSDPSNWDWDGRTKFVGIYRNAAGHLAHYTELCRFWILIYKAAAPIFWGAAGAGPKGNGSGLTWGATPVGSGSVWGYDGTNQWYIDVRGIIEQWKAAGSHAGAGRTFDGGIIDVTGDPLTTFNPENPPDPSGVTMPNGTWGNPANRNDELGVYLGGI